jgi:subtilisin family serine protease
MPGGAADPPPPRRFLARLRPGAAARAGEFLAGTGLRRREGLESIGVWILEADPGAAAPRLERTAAADALEWIESDGVARAGSEPNDPCYPAQWHLRTLEGPAAWELVAGREPALLAVVDSGVDPAHPDLRGALVPGWNFLKGTRDTSDVLGHGTSVAGAAAAAANNAVGGAGVAAGVRVMPLVALDANNRASYSDIARAILYAADHGARVINVSLGGSGPSLALDRAVEYAWDRGCLVVASAMNTGDSTPHYPAASPRALAVSATTAAVTPAGFSTYGDWIDFSGPGASILTTAAGGRYAWRHGTSFAAPMVSGTLALMLAARPRASAEELVALLEESAEDLGAPGPDPYFGRGRVHARRAVERAAAGPR